MKRPSHYLTALLLLTIFVASPLLLPHGSADLRAQSLMRFGLKGAVNLADVNGLPYGDTRTGGMIGLSLDLSPPLFPLGLETGLYYTQKGSQYTTGAAAGELTTTLKLDYVEIPVLARLNLLPLPVVTPHIIAGPYIGFNVNAEQETVNGTTATLDMSEQTRPTDWGGIVGAGSDFNLGLTSINLQARYSFGLQNIFETDLENGEKHRVISIVLGVAF